MCRRKSAGSFEGDMYIDKNTFRGWALIVVGVAIFICCMYHVHVLHDYRGGLVRKAPGTLGLMLVLFGWQLRKRVSK
jgi:hypothetical protein